MSYLKDITNIKFRSYQSGDDEGIVELLKKTFPKWGKFDNPLKLWRWKYINTPQKSLISLAIVDNKIIGCHHSIVFNAKLGLEIMGLGYSDDFTVDIDYRGLGLSSKIGVCNENAFATLTKYNYLTTVNPILKKSYKKSGRGVFPFPVTRMVKIRDIGLQLQMKPMKKKYQVKIGYTFLKILNRITNIFTSSIKYVGDFNIITIPEFDEKINLFWMKIKDDYSFILEKKRDYLNWRFIDNERGKHVKIQAVKGDEVLGYAVLGLRVEDGYVEGLVEDLIAVKDRVDVADALLGYACKYFDGEGINAVYYQVVEGHPYQELSRRKGFIDSHSRSYISFEYSDIKQKESEIQFLKHTAPNQVYFNYAETL